MKRSESRSMLVTGFFLAMLTALLGAGLFPATPEAEPVVAPDLDHYVPEMQFMQYLEYRARLADESTSCQ